MRPLVAALGLVVAGALVAIPTIGSAYVLQLATDILAFTTLAYSWNLISGFTGYVSFGQVSFFGLGAYTTALLVLYTSIPWYVGVVLAGVFGAAMALVLGLVMLRLRGILFALGMFGLARILTVIASNWSLTNGAVGLTLPAQLTPIAVYIGTIAAALGAFGLNLFFSRSGFGLDAMSVRDDEDAAVALGVPTTRVKILSFVMSAVPPAIIGGLVAWNRSFIDPASAFDSAIDLRAIVFALFGGIGTLWGPALGSVVLMVVAEQLWAHVPELELALFGGLVIAVVLALPGGLVGLTNQLGWLRRRPILAPRVFPEARPSPVPPPRRSDAPVLDVRDVTVRFGGVVALDHVSFRVESGETVSIIGANGAGKTTLFNAITGFVTPTGGAIYYYGAPITGVVPFELARRGVARTFQIPRLMDSMSVWENVVLASRHGKQSRNAVHHAAWALATVGLDPMWLESAERLTPGQRRRLEFARVLALQPTVVLLDEVMAGMTRDEQEEIRQAIRQLKALGVAAVAGVEHVVSAIADLSDRMIVLDFGKKIAEGAPGTVLRDPVVVRAYLGEPV